MRKNSATRQPITIHLKHSLYIYSKTVKLPRTKPKAEIEKEKQDGRLRKENKHI